MAKFPVDTKPMLKDSASFREKFGGAIKPLMPQVFSLYIVGSEEYAHRLGFKGNGRSHRQDPEAVVYINSGDAHPALFIQYPLSRIYVTEEARVRAYREGERASERLGMAIRYAQDRLVIEPKLFMEF